MTPNGEHQKNGLVRSWPRVKILTPHYLCEIPTSHERGKSLICGTGVLFRTCSCPGVWFHLNFCSSGIVCLWLCRVHRTYHRARTSASEECGQQKQETVGLQAKTSESCSLSKGSRSPRPWTGPETAGSELRQTLSLRPLQCQFNSISQC